MKNLFTFKKLCTVFLAVVLIISLSACKKDNNNTPNDTNSNSKPVQSEQKDDNNDTQSNGENDTDSENSKEDKTDNNESENSKPQPVKKTAKELIVGKWVAKSDIAMELADYGINVDGPLEITLNTEFTTSGTLIEKADNKQMYSVLVVATKQALLDEIAAQNTTQADFEAEIGMTIDEYVEAYLSTIDYENMFVFNGEYKFIGDVLWVKSEDTDFVETQYTFINDNTLKITTDDDETIYTRVK